MIVNLRCGEAGAAKFEFIGETSEHQYVSVIIPSYIHTYNIIMIETIYDFILCFLFIRTYRHLH